MSGSKLMVVLISVLLVSCYGPVALSWRVNSSLYEKKNTIDSIMILPCEASVAKKVDMSGSTKITLLVDTAYSRMFTDSIKMAVKKIGISPVSIDSSIHKVDPDSIGCFLSSFANYLLFMYSFKFEKKATMEFALKLSPNDSAFIPRFGYRYLLVSEFIGVDSKSLGYKPYKVISNSILGTILFNVLFSTKNISAFGIFVVSVIDCSNGEILWTDCEPVIHSKVKDEVKEKCTLLFQRFSNILSGKNELIDNTDKQLKKWHW